MAPIHALGKSLKMICLEQEKWQELYIPLPSSVATPLVVVIIVVLEYVYTRPMQQTATRWRNDDKGSTLYNNIPLLGGNIQPTVVDEALQRENGIL